MGGGAGVREFFTKNPNVKKNTKMFCFFFGGEGGARGGGRGLG